MITLSEIKDILNHKDRGLTEGMARQSREITRQYFGRVISLYAPLYLSNYCSSHCTYCGFQSRRGIKRFKLKPEEIKKEMACLAQRGIENILLLTGESYKATPLSYLKESVRVAKEYFPNISLEVHPVRESEYQELFRGGVDGITTYQETYDRERYKEVHLSGKKADYDYRYQTPQRAARGGIRNISMGILLGLADAAEDLHALYQHLRFMEKNFPGVEYSLSFPRLQPIRNNHKPTPVKGPLAPTGAFTAPEAGLVDDETFIKIICLTRIHFPRVGINLSTRENPRLRDHILELGVTRLSAGSSTAVGGYTLASKKAQNPQFDIQDHRSLQDIVQILKKRDFDPVLTDWRRIENDPF